MQSQKREYSDIAAACEEDLRAGRVSQVHSRLQKLIPPKIPRESRKALANICWRAGLTSLGLKILHPLIHPSGRRADANASAEERAEHAILLTRIGATNEARRGLEAIPADAIPDALLYRAFCHFAYWEHGKAIPLLENYCRLQTQDYKRLVGRVNLAAALVATERYPEALELLDANIEMARQGGHARLLANCLEIRGQIHVHQRDFGLAREDLNSARSTLGTVQTYDQLFVRKWSALLDALESGKPGPLLEFRREAAARNESESVREADRFHLRVDFQDAVYQHLIYGTPAPDYRERLIKEHAGRAIAERYVIGSSEHAVFDIETGRFNKNDLVHELEASAAPGRKIHQLLEILTRDFYRPLRIGSLFAELFPKDHFDVYSSPNRVHVWLWHLRDWMREAKLPFHVQESRGTYLLRATEEGSCGLLVRLDRERPDAHTLQWRELLGHVGHEAFTAKAAALSSGIKRTSLQRLLTWALAEGLVVREKHGTQVVYKPISGEPALQLRSAA